MLSIRVAVRGEVVPLLLFLDLRVGHLEWVLVPVGLFR